jgi:hypothetical protein
MANNDNNTSKRGFAAMSEDERRELASKGGQASTGKFGDAKGADPHKAGSEGAKAQPRAAKVKGGKNSHRGDS